MKSLSVLFIVLFVFQVFAIAGISDTISTFDSNRYSFFLPDDFDFASVNPSSFKNTPDAFHNYNPNMQLFGMFVDDQRISLFPNNGIIKASSTLGNLGTPSNDIVFDWNRNNEMPSNTHGADLINNAFDDYLFDANRRRFFDVKSPLTELYFVSGAKKEQIFQVLHTQNINNFVNVGIEYRKFGSEGFYRRQESNIENFRGFLSAKSKNNRYRILAHTIWNNVNVNENGGILADSLFEFGENITKSTIAVNLLDAHSQGSNQSYYLRQSIDVGKNISREINDTVNKIEFIPKYRFAHTIVYQNWSKYYIDNSPDTSNYLMFLNDASYTSNYTYSDKLTNKIDWTNLRDSVRKKTKVKLSLNHELNRYKQNETDSNFSNIIFSGQLSNNKLSKIHWKVNGAYCIYGGNRDDINTALHLDLKNKEFSNQLNLDAGSVLRTSSLMHSIYSGNHFQWKNKFLKVRYDFIKLSYLIEKYKFSVGLKASQFQNFIYNNEMAMPEQDSGLVNVISGLLVKDFRWRKLGVRNTLIFQYSGDSSVLNVPSVLSYHALYYENWIFKNALYFQAGFDVFYNTAYFANDYMPSTGLFYLQSTKKVGNYPYLNFFINFKVKQARVFFKIEHLNQGYMGNVYYSVPHYPMPDRSFKVGISWLFYD